MSNIDVTEKKSRNSVWLVSIEITGRLIMKYMLLLRGISIPENLMPYVI